MKENKTEDNAVHLSKHQKHERRHREHIIHKEERRKDHLNFDLNKKGRLEKMYKELEWPKNSKFLLGLKFMIFGAFFMIIICFSQLTIVVMDIINNSTEAFDEEIAWKAISMGSTLWLFILFLKTYNKDVNIIRFARHYVRIAYDVEEQSHHELDLDHINFEKLNIAFARWSTLLRLIFVASFASILFSLTSTSYKYNWEWGAKYLSIGKNFIIITYVIISSLFVSTVRRPDLYPQVVFEEDHVWQKIKVKDLTPEQLKAHMEKKAHHGHHDDHGDGHGPKHHTAEHRKRKHRAHKEQTKTLKNVKKAATKLVPETEDKKEVLKAINSASKLGKAIQKNATASKSKSTTKKTTNSRAKKTTVSKK